MTSKTGRRAAAGSLALAASALVVDAKLLQAQRVDTTRAGAAPTTLRPPLSPRRAFLTSVLVPGYGQSILGRPNAAAFFILTEAIGIFMVREAAIELRQARRLQDDSVAAYFLNPVTGAPDDTVYRSARYPSDLVRARRAHLEDWIAALVANHLIAGADAFVAAHLWDVPIRVGFRTMRGTATLSARYRW